jgi:glycosyltransferase involved in cell wall biosynthesis
MPVGVVQRAKRVVSVQTSSERGGAEYANVDLLVALAERGWDVTLVTNQPELARGTRLPVRTIDLGPKLRRANWPRVLGAAPLSALRLARALRELRPTATLVHFKKEQLLVGAMPARLTGDVVWAEWGPVPFPMRRGPGRWLYVRAARRARRVFCVSVGTADSVIAAGVPSDKVDVLPVLIDVDAIGFDPTSRERLRDQWGIGPFEFVIGCLTRLQRKKRVGVAIDAMADLDGHARLLIAGEGEEEATLRAQAAPWGDRIMFVGNVRGQAAAFLSACDVLVFTPSPTEGAPRAISLAQLVGLPVISTASPGAAELMGEGSGTVLDRPNDPQALAEALVAYRDDPERRRREGEVGRRLAVARHDRERTLLALEAAIGLRS